VRGLSPSLRREEGGAGHSDRGPFGSSERGSPDEDYTSDNYKGGARRSLDTKLSRKVRNYEERKTSTLGLII